jgi:hypothetical protein
VNASQLTTIWLYLLNAHNYVQAALLTAKTFSDTDVHARLSDLHQRTQAEIANIENLRGAANGTPPSN